MIVRKIFFTDNIHKQLFSCISLTTRNENDAVDLLVT